MHTFFFTILKLLVDLPMKPLKPKATLFLHRDPRWSLRYTLMKAETTDKVFFVLFQNYEVFKTIYTSEYFVIMLITMTKILFLNRMKACDFTFDYSFFVIHHLNCDESMICLYFLLNCISTLGAQHVFKENMPKSTSLSM